jgi:hypothetical protein
MIEEVKKCDECKIALNSENGIEILGQITVPGNSLILAGKSIPDWIYGEAFEIEQP